MSDETINSLHLVQLHHVISTVDCPVGQHSIEKAVTTEIVQLAEKTESKKKKARRSSDTMISTGWDLPLTLGPLQ